MIFLPSGGKKGQEEGVYLFGRLPHRDVAALLNDVKFRALDGSLQGLTHRRGKEEVIFSPDEQGGPVNTGKAFL